MQYSNHLTWSPDGKYLAFVSFLPGSSDMLNLKLFMLPLDTLQPTLVKTGCGSVSFPSFSPRGTYLAWVCNDQVSGSSSLHLLRRSDCNFTQILNQAEGIDVGVAQTH